jgi:hypothetical protein
MAGQVLGLEEDWDILVAYFGLLEVHTMGA